MILPSDLTDVTTWYNPRKKRFWALALIALYTLAGFFLVPWIIKTELPKQAQNILFRDAQVQQVRFNPWTLRLQINGFELRDDDGSRIASFDELVANLQTRSIFKLALVFHEVSLTAPEVNVVRYAFADSNVGRILNDMDASAANAESVQTEESTSVAGFRLVVDTLNINDGIVQLSDEMPDTAFNTRLEPINISVSNLSTLPDDPGTQQINIVTETGASLTWTGSLELSPLKSAGEIELSGSPLPLIYRYFREQLNFRLDDCCLDIALKYTLAATADGGIAAHVADLSLSARKIDMRVLESVGDESIFQLPELRISGGDIQWPEKTVRIGEVLIDRPDIEIWTDADGILNLNTLLPPESGEKEFSDEFSDKSADPAGGPLTAEEEPSAPDEPATDWNISLASFRIAGLRLGYEDRSLPTAGRLDISGAEIRISEVSNQPDILSPFEVSAIVGETGSIQLDGVAGMLPTTSVDAKIRIADLAIPALQPWIEQMASISINEGTFGLEGSLQSDSAEQLEALADIYIDNLAISDTLENEALVGWNRLMLEQTRLQLAAGRLEISQVRLNEPFARLIIAADGTTNFQSLVLDESGDQAEAPPETSSPNSGDTKVEDKSPFVFEVGKTTITDGSIDFSDFSLPLPFSAPISNFGGELSALASNSSQPSDLNLEGQVGEYGLVKVGGLISVMAPTDQSNIEVDFRNINVPDLSPYTAQFAGRKIASGKLSLDLDYGFTNRKVVGENKIVLEEFELGEKVDNPDAMSLPLDLAVGLLRDVNGVIDLQLNVSGDLDDPSFSASGIILKAFANLITKLVAAPFKLLGKLIPGGENVEFDAVDFQPGRADLAPPEREKLDKLAEALVLRPALQLKVPAGFNREADARALQAMSLDSQLNELLGSDATGEQEMLTRRTRKALEKLAKQQLPDLSTKELRNEFQRESPAADGSEFDEVAYMAELRLRLEDVQPVDDMQLTTLAENRRASIMSELTSRDTLNSAQLAMGNVAEASISDDAWIRLELSLEMGIPPDTAVTTDGN